MDGDSSRSCSQEEEENAHTRSDTLDSPIENPMNPSHWSTQLAVYPYAQPLLIGWQIADHSRDYHWPEYEQALNAYLASQDAAHSEDERQAWLHASQERFTALAANGDAHIGTSFALIRINAELGERQAALDAIEQLLQIMPWLAEPLPEELQLQINRPFVAPLAAFDLRPVEDGLGEWLQAGLRESLETLERPEFSF